MKNFNLFNRSNAQKNTSCASVNVSNASPRDDREITERLPRRYRWAKLAATLTLLLTLSVGQMWAVSEGSKWYDASSAKVYFDNTNSSYTNVSILIGRQWTYGSEAIGSSGTNLSKISGTNNLYYASVSFTKYTTFAFINATNWGWETNKVTSRLNYCTNTDTPNDNLGSSTHLYVPASGNDNASVTHTTPSNYTALNYTQTLNQTLSTDGGSTYSASTTALATVKVASKKLNGNSSTTDDSGTISSGSSSTSCAAARTATVTYSVASVKTGYEFVGWYEGTTQKSTSTSYTYNATEAKTITARFKEKQYSLTFSHNGHGTIKVGGTTIDAGGTANVGHFTTKTLVATASTGYNFSGWTKSGSNTSAVTIADMTSAGASTTIKATNTGATITAGFTAKTYTITLDGNGGSDGSATATYNSSTLTSVTGCSRASYDLNGYYTETSGGTKIIDSDGSLVASVSGYTNSSSQWIKDANVELHAQWTYNPVTYSVTYGVGTDYSSYGSLSAKNSSTSAAISSGSSVESGTGVTFTATPNTHYKVAGWYSNAGCTSAIAGAGTGNTYSATISANTTVYVKFVVKQCTITLNRNGGSAGTTSVTATHGSTLPSFTAHTRTGYTLNGYYTESSGGTKIIDAEGAFVASTTYANSSKQWNNDATTLTLYAQWTENMTTVTINVDPIGAGTLTLDGSAFTSGNTTTAGVTTNHTVVATPANDYMFNKWTKGGNATGTASTNTYTLKGNGSAGEGTLTASFTAVPCSLYYGSSTPLNSPTSVAMSYDQATGAYYKDVKTNSSPYYFRFYHNNSTEWSGDWNTYPDVNAVAGTGTKVNCATEVSSWENKASLKYTGTSSSSIRIWFDYQNKKAWITETTYTVSIAAQTGGSVSTSSVSGVGASIPSGDITATPEKGYVFTGWTLPSGTTAATGYSASSNPIKINATADGKTITAKFAAATAFIEGRFHITNTSRNGTWTNTFSSGDWDENSTAIKFTWDATNQRYYLHTYATPKELTTQISSFNPVFYIKKSSSSSSLANVASYWSASSQTLSAAGYANKKALVSTGTLNNANLRFNSTDESGYVILYFDESHIWYELEQTLQYDANGGSGTKPAALTYYDRGTTVNAATNTYSRTGYAFTGWKTGASSGTSYAEGATFALNSNVTLYAQWSENQYNATVSAGAGGSVSPSGTVAIKQVNGTSITATPSTGYSFQNWTISGGGITPTSSNKATQTFKATSTGGTITANFTENKFTVSVASNNTAFGTVSPTSVSSVGVATASAEITATPKTGATFTGWTFSSASITAATGYTTSSNPIKINASAASQTLTANFSETKYTVSMNSANTSRGTVGAASASVGQITAVQITATPKTGYMFNGWVKTAGSGTVTYHVGAGTGQIVDAGGASKATTYITVTGAVTLQATWDEDRSSGYFVHYGNDGKNADGGDDASQARAWADGNLYKNSGETAGTVSYWTFTASSTDVGKVIEFKVLAGDPSDLEHATWYGYSSASGGKITASITDKTLNTSYGNGRLVIPTPGDYVFKWNSSGNKLSITYPAGNYVRGEFNSWGWTNEMTGSGPYTATIHLPADALYATASSGSTGFKYVIGGVHYGKNGTISSTSPTLSSCTTSGQNMGLATTMEGDYTFQVNSAKTQVTVTYPTITAMAGTLGLNVAGARSGDGDILTPYIIFAGETLTLSPNHTSAPSADDHFKYTYYKGANNTSTATTELATKLSTAASTSYGLDVGSTTGKYPLKISAYYEYGPDGYKAKGTTIESSIKYYRVMLAPAVALTASKVSIKEGTDATFTLTATPSNVDLASSLIKVSYEFFNGNSTAAANKIGETIQKTDGTAATQTITPTYNTTTNSWTYTVKMTYLGIEKTSTVTVYRKWDIYVDDAAACNWGTMKLYMWDAGGAYPVAFPGTAMPLVEGSTHWHVVTLDTRYPNFKLSKQSGTESNNHTASISTYPAGTYWYLNSCTTLTKLTLTNPTVTLTASVANCKDITLTGNVSNFGGDGLAASRLKSVKFIVEGSDRAATTVSTSNGNFSVTLTNATAGATNTLQAYAENIRGSAVSGVLRYSNVTLDLDGGTGGTTAVTAVNGMAMPTGATAPTKEGYKFGGYYASKNGGGRQYYSASMTSANTWNQTAQNVTIYAKWIPKVTYNVYFYNKDNWSTPKAYMWQNGSSPLVNNAAWPGEAMSVHQGPVYKLDYESADSYDRIIFSDNGNSARRTGDRTLPATNSWFFNPEDSLTASNGWTRYIMVGNYPTETQVAVVGEKKTIDPVVAWADGVGFNQVTITATRDSGSTAVTAAIAGTKIIATSSAAGTAKFSITYTHKTTTITKVVRFQFLEGLTVQAKIDTADAKWEDSGKVRIHYWGNAAGDPTGDITMSYLKLEGTEYYFQALVPKGSNGYANFLFFYDYMENTDANRWRQTENQTANTEKCYTISYEGHTNRKSTCTSTPGLCATSWQLRIIMGSGDIYTSNSVTSSDDIVSFFAPANKSGDPSYRKGTISLEYNGATVHTYPTNLVSASGVYTAKITTTSPYTLTDIAPYTGDYYIRTDPSKGGWDKYKEEASNKLTKFTRNTNFPNETFSYYWVDNVAKTSGGSGNVNIKATVANEYNPVLCSFSADESVAREEHGLNLRFGYEPTTNDLIRGILRGATFNDFLNLIGSTGNIYKEITCDTLFNDDFYNTSDNFKGKCKLQDKSNWVYEIIVYAKIDATHPTADVVLKSYYNGLHYLLGMVKDPDGRDTSTPESFRIINTGTTDGIYGLRVIYDFKTNRLFGAWAPADRTVDGILNVDADIMFLRHEFDDVAQIGFKTSNPTTNKITDLNHAIFALEIDNDQKKPLKNRELHYFISLPFDCQVSNIFGIGGYMNYWGIQRYRGDLRAKNGWFQETDSFWEWLTEDDVLEAGEGYLVSIDKKAMQNDGVWKEGIIYQTQEVLLDGNGDPVKTVGGLDSMVWVTHTDGSLLTLYFPSTTSGFEIKPAAGSELVITYPELECKITRANRNLYDSNWRCLGTPGYKNITINSWDTTGSNFDPDTIPPQFLYEFHEQTTAATYAPGTYKVVDGSTYTYHSFNSYMVQYAGTINWNVYSKGEGASSPLRRLPRKDATITKLQLDLLNDEGTELDRAFVWLQDEATLGYDKNFDLNKMVDTRLNQIYSLAEHDAPYAANVLPLETDTVALVVNITKAGEFTFSLLKEKHCGLTPILYDMYENVQTNLLADDYTVDLTKGKYTGRFFIIFQAGEPVATNFETTSDGGQKVLSDEAIYDVLGRRVDVVYPGLLYIVNGEKRIAK